MEEMAYKGWANCRRLANRSVELIITGDVGPRIIRFGFVGGENEFREYPQMLGRTGDKEWLIYGGHRLWHAPEDVPRSYVPDNGPVSVEDQGEFVRVVQPVEAGTGIQKELDVTLSAKEAHVKVTHRLRNTGAWPVELAAWALSVMEQGGRAVIPLPPRGSNTAKMLPTSLLSLWAYTDMSDPRWTWGEKYIMLRQDPKAKKPQKAGTTAPDGWAAYARGGHLFLKKFAYREGAGYPDFGCSVETFTNADMLELETLGPMTTLAPGATVEHVEDWFLFDGVGEPRNDADIDKNILPKIKTARVE
jgi:hypothetical protein